MSYTKTFYLYFIFAEVHYIQDGKVMRDLTHTTELDLRYDSLSELKDEICEKLKSEGYGRGIEKLIIHSMSLLHTTEDTFASED